MSERRLTPRQQFDHAYRRFRQYGESDDFLYMRNTSNEMVQAADYAYEAKFYRFSGWINRRRHTQFLNKRALLWHGRELPF